MSDIVTRLRQTRADMIGTDDEQHYWDCHDAAAQIERLRLTDAEREAVEKAARLSSDWGPEWADHTATLRGLLERVSDRPKPIATPLAECTPGVCTYPPECTDTGKT